jgi:hypothetical protein
MGGERFKRKIAKALGRRVSPLAKAGRRRSAAIRGN